MWPFSNSSWQLVARAKKDQQAAAIDEGLQAAGPATAQDQVYLSSSGALRVVRGQSETLKARMSSQQHCSQDSDGTVDGWRGDPGLRSTRRCGQRAAQLPS